MAQKYNTALNFELLANAKQFNSELKNANRQFGSFTKSVNNLAGFAAGGFLASEFAQVTAGIIQTRGEFQKFEAVLTNTLGSSGLAKQALSDISEFAANTPFAVDQVTASFVKLANQGFTPTVSELTKLGDLASSTGKNFDQLAEAVLDAQQGEFERLKEFGIKAQKEGDKVRFTFKGVQTQTEFTSEAIQRYILSLGTAEGVSGSMAAISGTLEGKLSTLGDASTNLSNKFGQLVEGPSGGIITFFTESLNAAGKFLDVIRQLETQPIVLDAGINESGGNILKNIEDLTERLAQVRNNLSGPVLSFERDELKKQEAELLGLISQQSKEYSEQVLLDQERQKLKKEQLELAKMEAAQAKALATAQQELLSLEKQRVAAIRDITIAMDAARLNNEGFQMSPTDALAIGRNNNLFSDDYLAGIEGALSEADKFKEVADTIKGVDNAFIDAANSLNLFGQTLGNSLASGAGAFESFKRAALASLSEVAAALIKNAILSALVTAILPGLGATGLAGILGGIGKAGQFGGLFNFGPGLASGGIIPPGYPNDTFNARLSSGEAVIPLDRLNKYVDNGSSGRIDVTHKIAADGIYVMIKNYEKKRNKLY